MPQGFKIDFRPITVPKDFPMKLYDRVEKSLIDYLKRGAGPTIQKEMKSATRTWQHKPDFPIEFRYLQWKMWIQVAPQGKNRDKWKFVSRGTRVRHAQMSPDFKAKTRPGSLRSSAGRGGVVRVSRAFHGPPIEAREFEEQIIDKHERSIRAEAGRVVKKALR